LEFVTLSDSSNSVMRAAILRSA